MDLRRMSTKKATLPPLLREQFRKDYDELRNQYEFRNKGMFEMIYPILDEITLDPIEEEMAPYVQMQEYAVRDYYKKNHLKAPLSLEKLKKLDAQANQEAVKTKSGGVQHSKGFSNNTSAFGSMTTSSEPMKVVKHNYRNVKSRVFENFKTKNPQQEEEEKKQQEPAAPAQLAV